MDTSGQAQAVIDDRFVLQAECKRGGMGTVWKARDLHTQRAVAVKILHDTSALQAQRFVREGSLLAGLDHPAIVAYVGHGITVQGVPYLAMEWLEGENIAERLARQALTLGESLAVLSSATRGLLVAHRRGIVHRDIKPSNLFLRQGRLDDVVLLDLGVARFAGSARDLTRTGSILGTPSYMAPEQAQGHDDVGPSADVFSLGCVLFECLAGDSPFVGAHVFSVLAKVLFEAAPRLRDLRPEIPALVEALVERMLHKDPTRRPADAGALLAELEALGRQPEVAAPGTTLPPRPSGIEQELVSVLLATADPWPAAVELRDAPEGAPPEAAGEDGRGRMPDVAAYGGELKRLLDGTTIVTLGQRGGAATDLCARAARCALRLREARPDWTFVLATGRGVSSGRAYIGEVVDRAGTMLRAGAGRAAGSIWLDEVTAGLLDARFRTTAVPGGMNVTELGGEDPSTDPGRRLLGRPTTCVGRDHELGMLELARRSCIEESSPRAVLVVGPAGIGKSRLRYEMLRQAQGAGQPGPEMLVLLGLGDPIRSAGSRGLLSGALARLCGIRADAPAGSNRAALEARIGRHLPGEDRPRTIAFLGELCGLVPAEQTLPELEAAQANPTLMADLTVRAWLTFLRAEAAVQPVLLVLDDLQWSDALTVKLVGAALRELGSSPFMVLALGRPEVQELFPDLWAPRLFTLPLPPLGSSATARLIRQVLGSEVSDDSVARIVERAGGNALYVEELIRAAEARREAVPETVLAMLQARIGLLPAGPRRILRAASVFGEQFPLAGVQALLDDTGSGEQLAPDLHTLAKHEILEQQAEQPSGTRWRFRHALMRDAAYGLWTAEDLARAHARAAAYLAGAGEEQAVIAAHYQRGGDKQRAIGHYIAAAEEAHRHNDLAAVVALVKQGLACGASGVERGILRSIEAPARFFLSQFSDSDAASQEGLDLLPAGHRKRTLSLAWSIYLAMQLGRPQVEARLEELLASEPAPADRASYLEALGNVFIARVVPGDRVQAQGLLSRMLELVPKEATDLLARGHVAYWHTRWLELAGDDTYATWRQAKQGVEYYRGTGDRRWAAYMGVELGECTRRLYSVAEGVALMRPAVEVARQIQEPVTISFVVHYLANVLAEHGSAADLVEARALAVEAVEQGGATVYAAFGQMALAMVDLRQGHLAAAAGHASRARDKVRALGMRSYFPHFDGVLLQVLLAQQDVTGAAALADQARALLDGEGPLGIIELSTRVQVARADLMTGRQELARQGVTLALRRLQARAQLVPDPKIRQAFLTDVPEHAALRALAAELKVG